MACTEVQLTFSVCFWARFTRPKNTLYLNAKFLFLCYDYG